MKKIFLLFFCFNLLNFAQAQLLLNELSADAGNNDAENDAIVEIINASGVAIDAGCTVISNSEWVVVLPPGTMIAAGDVFMIGCGIGQNAGSNANPSPGSGLTCADCDFPNLPLDFDVCDPVNAAYIDWAGTGFTLDNSAVDDGDQVAMFANDGTVLDAVYWGCGSASLSSDNTTLVDPTCTTSTGRGGGNMPYTLGAATWNGNGNVANLPAALQSGGACDSGSTYTMPPISSGQYANLSPVQTSCNSSMVRNIGSTGSGAAGAWGQTNHPNPSEQNDFIPFQFFIDGTPVDAGTQSEIICGTPAAITITVEVYAYQHVEDVATFTTANRTTLGSYFSLNGSAPAFWNGGISGAGTGTTTLTHTFTPANGDELALVWDDWTQSPINPNCCGSSSTNAASSGSNECYEGLILQYVIEEPLAGTPTITCDDAATGAFSVAGITAGTSVMYELRLVSDGSVFSSNATGLFTLPSTAGVPADFEVYAINPCGEIQATGSVCVGDPPCPDPQGATINGGTDPITICPDDCFDLTVDGTASANLPDGGTIDWYYGTDAAFDPCDDTSAGFGGQLSNSSDISVTGSGGSGGILINEVLYDPSANDGSGAFDESIELFNNSNAMIDIGDWVITDGDSDEVIPTGTMLSSCSYYVIDFESALTNSGEQLGLYDDDGNFIDGMFYENGQDIGNPADSDCSHVIPTNSGNMTVNICTDITSAGITNAGTAGNGQSLELNSDGTWSAVTPSNQPLTGGANTDQTACPVVGAATTITTANNCFDNSFCNNGPLFIKGVVNPAALSSTCLKSDVIVGTFEVNVVCPALTISGTDDVCAPTDGMLTITVANAPADAAVSGITITDAGGTGTNTFGPFSGTADANGDLSITATGINITGDYAITAGTVAGSTCPTFNGLGIVTVFPQPDLTLSGTDMVCPGEVGQLTVSINGGIAPFEVEVDTDGQAGAEFVTTINNTGVLNIPTGAADAGSTITVSLLSATDDNGCVGVVTGTGTIMVAAIPTAPTAGNNPDICVNSGETTADIDWVLTDPGAGFTVDVFDVAVGGMTIATGLAGGSGDITHSETGVSGNYPQTVTRYFEITDTNTGCTNFIRTVVDVNVLICNACNADNGNMTITIINN